MKKVLIVEDDQDTLDALTMIIRDWGFQVAKAATAKQALACIECSCPDVLISDLMLPDVNGTALLRLVRQGPCDQIVFFLITGHPSVSTAVDAIHHGAQEVLLKPLDLLRLQSLLEKWTSS